MKIRKAACILLALLLLPAAACGEGKRRVFSAEETTPFEPGAQLLTLTVVPLLGADSMLLTLGEHSMLIDAGTDTQAKTVMETVKSAGLDAVEYVLNTHPHGDHLGGVIPLLNGGLGIGKFITLFPHDYVERITAFDYQGETIRALEKAGIPVMDMKAGDRIPFGEAELTLMRIPDGDINPTTTCNEMSAMLMVRYGECSLLLTADVEPTQHSQVRLAELYDLKADILKFPHHGMSLMAPEFSGETDPEMVFFTHGAGDTQRAQRWAVQHGLDRMYFATWGPITLQTDGSKWIAGQEILPEFREVAERYVLKE